jgi:hypothetical protein
MSTIVLGSVVLLVALILLEGRRQARRYGRGSGKGASLVQAGLLDLQRHLEPERKVERLERSDTQGNPSGDPPVPGSRGPLPPL